MIPRFVSARVKWLTLIYFIQCTYSSFSQPSNFDQKYVDSVTPRLAAYPDDTAKVNKLEKLASMYILVNPVLTVQYAREGAAIADKINYYEGRIRCLGQSAFYFAITGEWAKASVDINEAIPLCEKYKPEKLIYLYNLMYINAATRGDVELALQFAQKALHHPAFSSMSDIAKWPTYMQLGRSYGGFNKLDSAKYYADLLAEYVIKYGKIVPDLASNSNVLFGLIAAKQKKYPEAINYYHLANYDIGLGEVYQLLHQRDSALYYGVIALKNAETQKNLAFAKDASRLLAAEYAGSDPTEANKYLNKYIAATDTLNNKEKLKQLEQIKLNEQKTEFDLQKKETATRNRYMQWSLLGILSFLLLFSVFLWRNNRFKQHTNRKLETAFKRLTATQNQLIQSEKMASLGELTAGIAHEIQNPLNFVNNFSEINKELLAEMKDEMDKGNLDDAKAIAGDIIENEKKINQHGKRADAIVKGMLQHSRSSSGVKEPTNINALADEYFRLAWHGLKAKDKSFNATMKTDYDERLGSMDIIPQDIGRVILNLVTNAFYAVSEKSKQAVAGYDPTITISTQKLNDSIEIRVKDNGTGIPSKLVDKIFQPFFTTKPTGQGTGLGLSLSYDIVKAHGGELKVMSREGEGTEFILVLASN